MITAFFIDHVETLAYEKAHGLGYIEERPRKKVSMVELFDMVAGTSSGALLGAALTVPAAPNSKEPRYYADDFIETLIQDGHSIFV